MMQNGRIILREHAPMLQDLRTKANQALGTICDEHAPHPDVVDYASQLRFFMDVVTGLENRAERARELVDEKSRGLLGCAFFRIFRHLLNTNPDFDFAAALCPRCPVVFRFAVRHTPPDEQDPHFDRSAPT